MRIRSNRCLYSAPPLYTGKGRPRKHGQKFKLNDSSTWWKATETLEVEDVKLGRLRVRRWKDLHFSGMTPGRVAQSMALLLPELVHLLLLPKLVESLQVGRKGTSVLKELVTLWSKKVKHDTKNGIKKLLNLLTFRNFSSFSA